MMKISDEEAQAAIRVYYDSDNETAISAMRAALEAAYTVRKARKAAKHAKAKPSILDEDQQEAMGQEIPARSYQSWYGNGELLNSAQAVPEPSKPEQPEHRFKVGDRVVHPSYGHGCVGEVDWSILPYRVYFDRGNVHWCTDAKLSPEPAKPAWNGKFEVGKAYRTQGGRRAIVDDSAGTASYPLRGRIDGTWTSWACDGRYLYRLAENPLDLIGPWED